MKTIKNLTPHAINLPQGMVEPSGIVARVQAREVETGEHVLGAAIIRQEFGEVEGLPAPEADTILVVSAMVKAACPDRDDLVSPARLVRDDAGRIVGCEALTK